MVHVILQGSTIWSRSPGKVCFGSGGVLEGLTPQKLWQKSGMNVLSVVDGIAVCLESRVRGTVDGEKNPAHLGRVKNSKDEVRCYN